MTKKKINILLSSILSLSTVATVVPTILINKSNNEDAQLKKATSANYLDTWNNNQIKTKYQTQHKILSYEKRTPAKQYTIEELKTTWGDDFNYIADARYWPQADIKKEIKDLDLNTYKTRYEQIKKIYGSTDPKITDNIPAEKYPMMTKGYLNWANQNNTLKKHPAADLQYGVGKSITDDTKSVKKSITFDLYDKSFISTGLYLPAGEYLTIRIPKEKLEFLKKIRLGLTFSLNELHNVNNYNSGWYQRMPSLGFERPMVVQTDSNSEDIRTDNNIYWKLSSDGQYYEVKYGTPLGGMVHIKNNTNRNLVNSLETNLITLEFSGAVEMLTYVHGITTENEWNSQIEKLSNPNHENRITVPVSDFTTDYIKFVGPWREINVFKSEDNDWKNPKWYPEKVMDWWTNMALDGYYTVNDENSEIPSVTMRTSNFVPAGEAVSFVRAFFVVQPWYWFDSILDIEKLISDANVSWGIMHEYNHQQQNDNWGFTGHGEVSNNTISLASYMKYANAVNNRSNTEPNKISFHNQKLIPYLQIKNAADQASKSSAPRNGIDVDYSIIASMFGPDIFQKIIRSYYDPTIGNITNNKIVYPDAIASGNNNRNARMVLRTSLITGYDWTDYYKNIKIITEQQANIISQFIKVNYSNYNFKKMMPVGSWYNSKINYDNFSKSSPYYSSSPILIPNNGKNYLFKKNYMAYVDANSGLKLENLKIVNEPINGQLTNNADGYMYNANDGAKYDSFTYSVDVLDNQNNKNTVEFLVEIQLENLANYELQSNINYITDKTYNDYSYNQNKDQIIESQKDNNIDIERTKEIIKLLNPGYKYYYKSTPANFFDPQSNEIIEAENHNDSTKTYKLGVEFKNPISTNSVTIDLAANGGLKQVDEIEIFYYKKDEPNSLVSVFKDNKIINSLKLDCILKETLTDVKGFVIHLKNNSPYDSNISVKNRVQISKFSSGIKKAYKPQEIIIPLDNQKNIVNSGFVINKSKGKYNNSSFVSKNINSNLSFTTSASLIAIYGYKSANGGEFTISSGSVSQTVSTNDKNADPSKNVLLGYLDISEINSKANLITINATNSNEIIISHIIAINSETPTYNGFETDFTQPNSLGDLTALYVALPILILCVIAVLTSVVLIKHLNKKKIKK